MEREAEETKERQELQATQKQREQQKKQHKTDSTRRKQDCTFSWAPCTSRSRNAAEQQEQAEQQHSKSVVSREALARALRALAGRFEKG